MWEAAIGLEELIDSHPLEVWSIAKEYGSIKTRERQEAVATCILEHLLEKKFELIFPLLTKEVTTGNKTLGLTFLMCWKFGQSKSSSNSKKWDRLVKYVQHLE